MTYHFWDHIITEVSTQRLETMDRKRASVYILALVGVLAAGLLTATLGSAAGDKPSAPMPEKLDAVLGGTIAEPGAKLTANDGKGGDQFGRRVAVNGNTAVMGAYGANSQNPNLGDSGRAYVFERVDGGWIQRAALEASNKGAGDRFGRSVAVSGNTLIVGADREDTMASNAGAAYVFTRNGNNWVEHAKLVANVADAGGSDQLGDSVAIDGDTVVVGAPLDDDKASNAGSAFVFVRSGDTWSQQARLLASDGESSDKFGTSVAISGDTVVVGAIAGERPGPSFDIQSGASYVFTRSGDTWTQQTKLIPDDGQSSDEFGKSVAISGETLVVGSPRHRVNRAGLPSLTGAGAAYVYVRSGDTWNQQAKLFARDAHAFEDFGTSVDLDGDRAAIGAKRDDVRGGDAGAAYMFQRLGTTWRQHQKLIPS